MYEETIDNILSLKDKDKKKLKNSFWKPYFDEDIRLNKSQYTRNLRILILNAPCNGFGDLIFALKLSNYLKEWYDSHVTIATTLESGLLNLGADPQYVVGLVTGSKKQCRRFNRLTLNKEIPKQDLIFVAPVQMDFDHSITDVKKLIPYATEFNTFSFSEYNDSLRKNFTFNTGIGKNRDGIFLTTNTTGNKLLSLPNPYSLIYVAETIDGVDKCMMAFIELISIKYHKIHRRLDVVVPSWFDEHFEDILYNNKFKNIIKFYPNIRIATKDNGLHIIRSDVSGNILTFRSNILPVENKVMMDLMSNSINDILLTGDQSITDALSCCSTKNIFYQIAPWKKDFAKNLATYMPNIFLKSVKTSCGTLKALKYKSNYSNFVKNNDFRLIGKTKLDAILLSSISMKHNADISDLVSLVNKTPNIKILKSKIRKMIEY
jgi:hypothetical protein